MFKLALNFPDAFSFVVKLIVIYAKLRLLFKNSLDFYFIDVKQITVVHSRMTSQLPLALLRKELAQHINEHNLRPTFTDSMGALKILINI